MSRLSPQLCDLGEEVACLSRPATGNQGRRSKRQRLEDRVVRAVPPGAVEELIDGTERLLGLPTGCSDPQLDRAKHDQRRNVPARLDFLREPADELEGLFRASEVWEQLEPVPLRQRNALGQPALLAEGAHPSVCSLCGQRPFERGSDDREVVHHRHRAAVVSLLDEQLQCALGLFDPLHFAELGPDDPTGAEDPSG